MFLSWFYLVFLVLLFFIMFLVFLFCYFLTGMDKFGSEEKQAGFFVIAKVANLCIILQPLDQIRHKMECIIAL